MITQIRGYNQAPTRATAPGSPFCMDYGFVWGNKATIDTNDSLIASNKGYNYYLLIADKYSCNLCIFLFVNKTLPIDTVTPCFSIHGLELGINHVHIDQGVKLKKNAAFCEYIATLGYTMETTGSGTSFQNIVVGSTHSNLLTWCTSCYWVSI